MPKNNQRPNFNDLYQTVGKIDGKLDGVLSHLDKINGRLDSHSKKIDDVETTTNQLVGKASIMGSIFGFVGGIITSVLTFIIRK